MKMFNLLRGKDAYFFVFTFFLLYSCLLCTSSTVLAQAWANDSKATVILSAKLTEKSDAIQEGMVWRVYSSELGTDNKLTLITKREGGTTRVELDPGTYLLHGSFGNAQVMQRINLIKGQELEKNFVLEAGGLKLNAVMPQGKINEKLLNFSIYVDDNESDEQALVIANVKSGELVRLKEGDYHIVSNYGSDNASVRFNTHVEAGRTLDVTIPQNAAQITLKLVRHEGGGALADTSWSISNSSGDIVKESVGAYSSLVLTEGEYVAVARNKDQIYQKEFSVTTGRDEDIDVIVEQRNQENYNDSLD